jgi:hypothetical protein
VLLAGAPNFSQLSSIQTLIELLFNTGSGVQTAFEEAVASIDAVVKEQMEQLLGPDLQPTTEEAAESSTPQKTFDDGMNPVNADSADANVPWDP